MKFKNIIKGFIDIDVGTNHSGLVTGNGHVYMFGTSVYGEMGLGEDIKSFSLSSVFGSSASSFNKENIYNKPTKIESLSNIIKISCGGRHTACIDDKGKLYTWGWGGNNYITGAVGGLGHGNKKSYSKPKQVKLLENEFIIDVSCGEKHTLCLTNDGKVYAFGEGEHGRLGTGHTSDSKKPQILKFFKDIPLKNVYASKEYSYGLNNDGIPFGWGRNDRSQMGQSYSLAMDMYSCDPTPCILNITNVIDMSLSHGDILAVDKDGNIYNWGDRVYLEPTLIYDERFQDNKPKGKIIHVCVTNSSFFFVTGMYIIFFVFFFCKTQKKTTTKKKKNWVNCLLAIKNLECKLIHLLWDKAVVIHIKLQDMLEHYQMKKLLKFLQMIQKYLQSVNEFHPQFNCNFDVPPL